MNYRSKNIRIQITKAFEPVEETIFFDNDLQSDSYIMRNQMSIEDVLKGINVAYISTPMTEYEVSLDFYRKYDRYAEEKFIGYVCYNVLDNYDYSKNIVLKHIGIYIKDTTLIMSPIELDNAYKNNKYLNKINQLEQIKKSFNGILNKVYSHTDTKGIEKVYYRVFIRKNNILRTQNEANKILDDFLDEFIPWLDERYY